MLFRTVYGPELEAIYRAVAGAGDPQPRPRLHRAFLPQAGAVSTQSVDDALAFLESLGLIAEVKGAFQAVGGEAAEPVRLAILRRLRALELGQLAPRHPLDPLYMLLLSELFIGPDQLFVADVHGAANRLRPVSEAGGVSREKVQAWKRVMTFLGIGQRVASGFRCAYSPALLRLILEQWAEPEGSLQQFFEGHLTALLPYQTHQGELAQAVAAPLRYLHEEGAVQLAPQPDSPAKPYFGEQKFRRLSRGEVAYA